MYKCDLCGGVFDKAVRRVSRNGNGEIVWEETDSLCPVCGVENRFRPVNPCVDCGGWRLPEEALCVHCRRRLFFHFASFVQSLTPAQRQQLDDWLDGESIEKYM